jgi:hypothetical protein
MAAAILLKNGPCTPFRLMFDKILETATIPEGDELIVVVASGYFGNGGQEPADTFAADQLLESLALRGDPKPEKPKPTKIVLIGCRSNRGPGGCAKNMRESAAKLRTAGYSVELRGSSIQPPSWARRKSTSKLNNWHAKIALFIHRHENSDKTVTDRAFAAIVGSSNMTRSAFGERDSTGGIKAGNVAECDTVFVSPGKPKYLGKPGLKGLCIDILNAPGLLSEQVEPGGCAEFCVNGSLAGNCRIVRSHNERKETRRT